MSLFRFVTLPCPACEEHVRFEAVSSVNADRRPDLRHEILANAFQRKPCPKCQVPFRLDPQFTYLDVGRGQWIVSRPHGAIGDFESLELRARTAFELSYGPNAPPVAKGLGESLQPRITFGWPALREKLFIADRGLSDIDLELTKMAVLRNSSDVPINSETELRLTDIRGDELIMKWIVGATGQIAQTLGISRGLYEEVAADRTGWEPLREELTDKYFVDMQRLMLPVA